MPKSKEPLSSSEPEKAETYVPETIPPLVLGHGRFSGPEQSGGRFGVYEDPADHTQIRGFSGDFTALDKARIEDNRVRRALDNALEEAREADGNFWAIVKELPHDDARRLQDILFPRRRDLAAYYNLMSTIEEGYDGPEEVRVRETAARMADALESLSDAEEAKKETIAAVEKVLKVDSRSQSSEVKKRPIGFN